MVVAFAVSIAIHEILAGLLPGVPAPIKEQVSRVQVATIGTRPTPTPKPVTPGLVHVQGSGGGGLSVRTGPGVNQPKIGIVRDGGTVSVIGQAAPGWAQVQGDGFSGYVSSQFLSGPIAAASNQPLAKLVQ